MFVCSAAQIHLFPSGSIHGFFFFSVLYLLISHITKWLLRIQCLVIFRCKYSMIFQKYLIKCWRLTHPSRFNIIIATQKRICYTLWWFFTARVCIHTRLTFIIHANFISYHAYLMWIEIICRMNELMYIPFISMLFLFFCFFLLLC